MSTPGAVDRIVRVLRSLPLLPDHAGAVHAAVLEALRDDGFHVEHEVPITLSDGREGRIDLVARRWGGATAIEIDARRPRTKSLDKLREFDGGRIMALRGVAGCGRFDGIDAIVPIRVRMLRSTDERDEARGAVGRAVYRRRRRAA